jgi:DNA polymerase III alpha subunit
MINIRLRSEYSFRKAFGPIQKVIETAGQKAVGVCDTGTWGHVTFSKQCKSLGVKPLFGAEISVVEDASDKSKQADNKMGFIAKNNAGLKEIYDLVTKSTDKEHFYYFPRLSYSELFDISDNIIMLSGTHPNLGS